MQIENFTLKHWNAKSKRLLEILLIKNSINEELRFKIVEFLKEVKEETKKIIK